MPAAPANTVVYGRAEHRKNWYHFVCDLGTARQNDGENMTDQAKTTIKVDWIDLDSIDSILSKVSGSAFRWVQNILEPVRSRPGLYPLHISMCLPSILVLLTSPLPLKCVCLAQHVILRSLSLSHLCETLSISFIVSPSNKDVLHPCPAALPLDLLQAS